MLLALLVSKMEDGNGNFNLAHCLDIKERTSDVLGANINFRGLFLSSAVICGLEKSGFVKPSPIQLEAIPLGRCGLDLIVQAKSGTGKTCVFVVIALEAIATSIQSGRTQVLVLAPTREIAVQINDAVIAIGSALPGLKSHYFIGGMPVEEDKLQMKHCHIAIGTPGRIQHLIKENVLKTKSIRLFVIDEADKLLDANFHDNINWIYSQLPPVKQMIALSATYKEEQAELLAKYMRNPTYVRLDALRPVLLGLKQFYLNIGEQHALLTKHFDNKAVYLLQLFSHVSFKQCLVFTNYQMRAQSLCDKLISKGWPAACIAGNQEQQVRLKTLLQLKKFECRVLITTDLTARGIDVENVDLVINLDVPWDTETYLHRIGRAGRFGSLGIAITLTACGGEQQRLEKIQSEANLDIKELPGFAQYSSLKRESTSRKCKSTSPRETAGMPSHSEAGAKVDESRVTPFIEEDFATCKEGFNIVVDKRKQFGNNTCAYRTYANIYSDYKKWCEEEAFMKNNKNHEPVTVLLSLEDSEITQDLSRKAYSTVTNSRCQFVTKLQKNLLELDSDANSKFSILINALQEYVSCGKYNVEVRSDLAREDCKDEISRDRVEMDNIVRKGNSEIEVVTNGMQKMFTSEHGEKGFSNIESNHRLSQNNWYSHCNLVKSYYRKWWKEHGAYAKLNTTKTYLPEYLKAMTMRTHGADIFS